MALHVLTVTLSGSAQQLTATVTPVRQIFFENDTGNADVKVGTSTLSSTVYGFIVEAGPSKPKSMGPFSGDSPLGLQEIWVLGTDTQKLRVTYIGH